MFRWIALLVALGSNITTANAMVLMSEMEGKLVDASGEPVAGVRLVRTWDWAWRNRQGSDETVTDAEGQFHFPMVTGRSRTARILPHEPSIRQTITAHHAGGETEIWLAIKRNYEENSELAGRPLRVVCGLTATPDADKERLYASLCVEMPAE
ncbi:MAG: DUF6795 domain-containing protein [Wenzhouxiangella sp.]